MRVPVRGDKATALPCKLLQLFEAHLPPGSAAGQTPAAASAAARRSLLAASPPSTWHPVAGSASPEPLLPLPQDLQYANGASRITPARSSEQQAGGNGAHVSSYSRSCSRCAAVLLSSRWRPSSAMVPVLQQKNGSSNRSASLRFLGSCGQTAQCLLLC